MIFDQWEPLYAEILEDFGFSRKRDEEAAWILSDLLKSQGRSTGTVMLKIRNLLVNRPVIICGNAPSLGGELEEAIKSGGDSVFIAADGAASILLRAGIKPDVIVTDLDGTVEDIVEASNRGSIVVVHAHGDNLDALQRHVADFKEVIGTVQCRPIRGVYNFGGFTDGDRCVFLARQLGVSSSRIRLIGFDYDDPGVTPRKSRKLQWAKRLIKITLSDGGWI